MAAETRRREHTEEFKWRCEIGKEETHRRKVAAAGTRKRERTEFLKWQREIREEQTCHENLRWKGKKKFHKVRSRL